MRAGFIGAGKVGFTLGKYLAMHGIEISGYYSRTPASAKEAAEFTQSRYYTSIEEITKDSDTLFLTVPDGTIGEIWDDMRNLPIKNKNICHCSGSIPSTVFFDAENRGAYRYSIHPLYAISSKATSYLDLGKACFTIEGSDAHLAELKALFSEMGNTVVAISPDSKALYHAAAVMVSNQIVALADMGTALLVKCGFSEAAAGFISPSSGKCAERGRKGCGKCTYRPHRAWRCPNRIEAFAGDTEICSGKHCRSGYSDSLHRPFQTAYQNCSAKAPAEGLQAFGKGVGTMKNTVATLQQQKLDGDKITMLTAYDYSTAKLVDECGVNTILVGDSLGMVMLGYEDTISVTMEDMIHHTAAVTRGAKNALVVGDMPFMSYQTSVYDAVVNAGRLMKEGRCQAVKLEGGASVCPQIKAITEASIPVVAHIGLTPQSVNAFGGFKVQGKSEADARRLIEEAKAVEAAGAFAIVLECIPAKLAKLITESVSIPTIGIGAGADCDGQVLVYQDMLALFSDFKPKFVKHFANAGEVMKQGFTEYIKEVKEGTFPAAEHTFKIADDIINKLY